MAFWAIEVKAGKPAVYVPPPEQARLRLSQATLSLEASSNERAALRCKVEGNDEVLICSLREGTQETTNLDLILDSYTEFSLATKSKNSKASIHLAGYLVAEEDEDDGEMEGEEDEDGLPEGMEGLTPQQLQAIMDQQDDSEGSDYEEGDEDSEEDEEDGSPNKSAVIIEDITDQEIAKAGASTAAEKANGALSKEEKNRIKADARVREAMKDAQALLDSIPQDEAEEEDSEEEDDDDESDEDAEEDSEEEEEEKIPVKASGNGKKAADLTTKLAARSAKEKGEKRKAAEPATKSSTQAAAQATAAEKKGKKIKVEAKTQKEVAATVGDAPKADEKPMKGKKTYPNGFVIENVAMGDPAGKLAKAGKKVSVKYVGKLQKTGKVFDQTKGNKPFQFRLGVNEVIKGWDQGVVGMRIGDKRKLTIPPQMGYGAKGINNVIPGNSTLVFEVELVDVK